MQFQFLIIITFVFGSLPVILYSIKEIHKRGIPRWIFSPLPIFYFSFFMAFIVRPVLSKYTGLGYDFNDLNQKYFFISQIMAIISNFSFILGYSLYTKNKKIIYDRECSLDKKISRNNFIYSKICQNISYSVSLIFLLMLFKHLVQINAISLDFGNNRAMYLESLIGSGHIFLYLNISMITLIVGVSLIFKTGYIGIFGIFIVILFLFENLLITNRSVISLVMFFLLFITYLWHIKIEKALNIRKILFWFVLFIFGAIYMGVIRGVSSDVAFFMPLFFLTLTFDMSDMLQATLENIREFDYGLSWFEDIVYTYVPRVLFPDKPTFYGTTRMQDTIVPSLSPQSEVFTATFPIGIYGESYANFGMFGVIIVFIFLGFLLKFIYTNTFFIVDNKDKYWFGVVNILIYISFCANSLGYMRSFGQFLSGIIFNIILVLFILFFIRLVSQILLRTSTY